MESPHGQPTAPSLLACRPPQSRDCSTADTGTRWYLGKDIMLGLKTVSWANALSVLPKKHDQLESEYIPQTQRMISLFFTLLQLGELLRAAQNEQVCQYALLPTSSCL